jgi:aminoglycoside phosphotransferase
MLRLAPDAAVPHRDALLDEEVVARLFLPVATCERVYAKYRVGESLRVVHRIDGTHHVAARTFRATRSLAAYERARASAVPSGALPPVVHAPELDAVFWTFPNDRRLAALPLLTAGSRALTELLGRPCAAIRLAAYAPERSASGACLDASGRPVAYVKVHAGDGAERERDRLAAAGPLAPPVIAISPEHGALALAPVDGCRLDTLRGRALQTALNGLGKAMATLHTTAPVPAQRFTRLDPERVAGAAEVIARARPDVARSAALASDGLLAEPDTGDPVVCVHGDANLRNAIAGDGRVTLLDLEHAAAGSAAADLGQLLAGLTTARVLERITVGDERALARALLEGYAAVARPPGELRWHTRASLLVRVAQSAVNRVRADVLRRLGPLLEEAVR